MTVLFVRHAAAGDREAWTAPDEERPLSAKGRRQADGLVQELAGFKVARILSSPYVRCVQTVEPLAAALGLPVEPADDLAEGASVAGLALVRELLHGADDVVLCTHGDVMEDVLDGLSVDRSYGTKKGATWVLDTGTARYLPPPG